MTVATTAAQAAAESLVDPRVAKLGGRRTSSKANYDFPGMMDAASWRRSEVHARTGWYGCGVCGQGHRERPLAPTAAESEVPALTAGRS